MPDLRHLPSVERLCVSLENSTALPRPLVTGLIKREVEAWRARLLDGEAATREAIESAVRSALLGFAASRLQPVINATGVLIHTNLGRSPLGTRAAEALGGVATGYSNLEFDLPAGERGPRAYYLETALALLLEAEAATAVDNCAAALVLTLRTLISPERNEVIVSRGELVEIGGGFRIPEILNTSGAKLVEVGTTNKTHLGDYEKALGGRTALILKVHRSNFHMAGFTSEPTATELAGVARAHGLPLVEDLGSGAIMATDALAPIDHEPRPQECLRNGIDLVLFSGDKLLGGPQAGIIAGRAPLVAAIKKEPFYRAVRCDKLILTVLQECIDDYLLARGRAAPDIPILTFLSTPLAELRGRADAIATGLADPALPADIEIVETTSRTGGGTMPNSELPSIALRIVPHGLPVEQLARRLRTGQPAVIGHTANDAHHLNLRSVFPRQDEALAHALADALRQSH